MKLFFYIFFISFLSLISLTERSYCQPVRAQFEHLTIEQGLSHNFVMDVMQDRKGYLWFGTGSGLDKYDGYHFTNYKYDPQDSTSLPKNQVFLIWEDNNHIIWIGTSEGTCKFDPRSEKFTRLEKSTSNPFAFKYAQSFNEDTEGNLWVAGSYEGELRQIERETGKFSSTNYASMLRAASDSNIKYTANLHIILKDKKGTLWIGSPFGLHRLHLTSQKPGKAAQISFTHYRHDPADSNSLSHNRVAGLYEDHAGILWIMTMEGVLNAFDPMSGKFIHYQPDKNQPLQIYTHLRTGISEDLAGNLWIGTFNGLYKLDKERKTFTSFFHDPTDPESLINNAIVSLRVDQSGILWIATMGGVDKLDPNKKPFGLYRHNPSNPRSLSHNSIAAICEDKEGIVWVGTRGGGLNVLNKRTGNFTHYRYNPKDAGSLRSDTVSAIMEDQQGNLWIGNGEILSRFNRNNQTFIHYSLHHRFYSNPSVSPINVIYQDKQGTFWLGTNNGIIRFDPITGQTVNYPYDPNNPQGISDYWALSILEDSRGNLWIGPGSQALMQFNRETGKFTYYKQDSQKPGSISSNTIPCIYEDTKGNLWFGTGEGGLCRFDYESETFTCYTDKQGLAGNSVFSILESDAGDLWLGTNNGLSKFSPANQTFTSYDTDDGLQSKMFAAIYTEAAAFKGKDGTMYFGGNNGFNAFHPADIETNVFVPPVVITSFKLFDKHLPGMQEATEIELNYNENFFSLEFAALNYTNTHKNQYTYKLEGVDKEWVQAGSRREANYTDIGHGRYIFKVKGANNDGIWNEKATTLTITIRPPFWKTSWAYSLYLVFFMIALLLARREIVRRERLKAHLKIKQVESDKLRELDTLKSHFFTNISHEFRTPLSLIQGTVEKLEKEDNSTKNRPDYQLINRNTNRLLQLINQLLDLSRLEAGKLSLHPEPGELTGFLSVLAASFASLYESKHIRYQYSISPEAVWTKFDRDKLEKMVVNLLSNAYKFTPAQGEVSFIAEIVQKNTTQCQLQLSVQDTGIGIPQQQQPRIFDRFHQVDTSATRSYEGTGIGLALVKELVELHRGEIRVESKEGTGTTFSLLLPFELSVACESEPAAESTQTAESLLTFFPAEEAAPQPVAVKHTSNNAIQILVVEDNAELRHFIIEQLSRQYKVTEAGNGRIGYEQALEIIPELIISDIMMPEMDGITFCRKLKTDERTSHIPVILLTAKADMESKMSGLDTGADDYLTKPFKLEELQLRVRNILESRRKLRERFSRQVSVNPKEITVTSTDERFLQKALTIMEYNMSNADLDVEAFSKDIGMSRAQLHRKITALTGLSTNEFIRSLRLKRAASLLIQHEGNVSQVAFEVGFGSLNYFTKCFRDFYGKTPTEYLRSHASARSDLEQ
jgi:signal transduction histidine kinase/ligand-binding sensor domain-containing protein/DNA-binding response OmpR family regulator